MKYPLPSVGAGLVLVLAWASPSNAQAVAAAQQTAGVGVRALGGFVNKQSLNGVQVGGEIYRTAGLDEPVELSVGVFYGRVTRRTIAPGCFAPPCSAARSFVEGTGLMLFNFEPGKRVRPFAGGGVTIGNYFDRTRYYSVAVAGGVNIALGNGGAMRIDARLAENFALMVGYGF